MELLDHSLLDQHTVESFYSKFPKEERTDIGIKQWKLLFRLETAFNKKPMTEFLGNVGFLDDKWPISETYTIDWKADQFLASKNSYPLILLLKITIYHHVQTLKQNPSIFHSNMSMFMEVFGKQFAREGILTASINEPFVPALVITEEKLAHYISNAITDGCVFSSNLLSFLRKVITTPQSQFDEASFLNIECELPWRNHKRKNGLKSEDVYLNSLLDEKKQRKKAKSYMAFSEEVCEKTLDFVIPLVTEHSQTLKKIFDIADNKNSQQPKNQKIFTAEARDKILIHSELLESIKPIKLHGGYNFPFAYINELYEIVQGAALWIIFLTTALRNEDVRKNLLRKCYESDDESDLVYYIVTDISKTDQKDYLVPVPEITVKAIDFLNSINYAPENITHLVVRRTLNRGGSPAKTWHYTNGDQVNTLLRKVAGIVGVDVLDGLEESDNPEGMAHRCRATMAGWIGTNSPLAVMIIRRLFGHTNGIMPEQYLQGNKAVQETRDEIQQKTYHDLSNSIADAVVNNNVGGSMKRNIQDGKEHIKQRIIEEAEVNNESLTQGEIRLRLRDRIAHILFHRLKNGEILGLQTPLAFVCMRNPASANDAPCAIDSNKRTLLQKNISKSFAKGLQMSGLPELDNCKGPLCKHALLFNSPITKLLLEQFNYYAAYLKGIKQTDINLDEEAERFINLYSAPLADVYPEIMEKISTEQSEIQHD
ncbi:hypothetical protein [Colwellia psychrerythraea]|uniref:Uncharacterized protein n=1 Tax=Colwellia psychrerythraea TaxID=28229 RepID=A0A099KH32_COLPS|nr:hypothetical protein [Colwellia psychrerythraea]KGJ89611.1 hypothetical protein ND2E_3802 [Colwellia psychrerythraea]